LLGRTDAVVMIHGGMGREERLKTQESFRHDPAVQVLLATDAAGEGINLQRAHTVATKICQRHLRLTLTAMRDSSAMPRRSTR
jgi:superfamily II DNA/RNA helicase